MNIYVDLDDVITHTATVILNLARTTIGRRVRISELTAFDLCNALGISREDHHSLLHQFHLPEVLRSLKPRVDALCWLRKHKDSERRLFIVTGRPVYTKSATTLWLSEQHIPYHDLLFVNKYNHSTACDESLRLGDLDSYSFSFAIEDSLETARLLHSLHGIPVALIARPWNKPKNEMLPQAIMRCNSWRTIDSNFINLQS